jgi:hypothetical protein
MTIRDLQSILNVSGLTDKEKMEVASDIILVQALDSGLDALNDLHIKIEEVIRNCYR